MRLYFILFLLSPVALAFSGGSSPPFCDNLKGTGLKEKTLIQFFDRLKTVLKKEAYGELSEMLRYPISVKLSNKKLTLKDKESFLAVASKVFIPTYKEKILQSKPEDRICRSEGVGLNYGALWIGAPNYGKYPDVLKVYGINN